MLSAAWEQSVDCKLWICWPGLVFQSVCLSIKFHVLVYPRCLVFVAECVDAAHEAARLMLLNVRPHSLQQQTQDI